MTFKTIIMVVLGCLAMMSLIMASTTSIPIQYDVNMTQAAFLFDENRLVLFEPNDLVDDIITSTRFTSFLDNNGSNCQFVDKRTNIPISLKISIFDALIHHDAIIICPNIQYTLETYSDWRNRVTPSDVEMIHEWATSLQYTEEKREYPNNGLEMLYLSLNSLIGWTIAFMKHHWGPLPEFPTYPLPPKDDTQVIDLGIYSFDGAPLSIAQSRALSEGTGKTDSDNIDTVFAVTGDWASGMVESDAVGHLIQTHNPHFTINLGDIYLVGGPEEIRTNVLGQRLPSDPFEKAVEWPTGSRGKFWYQGNHEAYARSEAYFKRLLPLFGLRDQITGKHIGQKTSYTVFENKYWRIICLDTGYTSYSPLLESEKNDQPQSVVDWLRDVVNIGNNNDKRGLIFMTHHNNVSAFKKNYKSTPKQIADLIGTKRSVIWFWGHEHKTALYQPSTIDGLYSYSRCIGTGGFPVDHVPLPPSALESGLFAYDNRYYKTYSEQFGTFEVGYNGYTRLTFNKNQLNVVYYTTQWTDDTHTKLDFKNSHIAMSETFTLDYNTGSLTQSDFKADPEITIVDVPRPRLSRPVNVLGSNSHDMAKSGITMETYYNTVEMTSSHRYTKKASVEPRFGENAVKAAMEKYTQMLVRPDGTPRDVSYSDYIIIDEQKFPAIIYDKL